MPCDGGYIRLFVLFRAFSDFENHRHHLFIYLLIAVDVAHQQFTGLGALFVRLVHNGSESGSNEGGSITISESDDSHILRNAQALGLDGIKGCIGDDVVEG